MATKVPQIAILGAGIFVKSQYIPRLSEISHLFHLKAIWSRSQESATAAVEVARKHFPGVECKWGDCGLEDIIQDGSIDAVAVVLAVQNQVDISLRVLKAGKHVLQGTSELETALSSYRSISADAPSQLIWSVAENYRFESGLLECKKLIGGIGKMMSVQVIIEGSMNSSNPYFSSNWRRKFTGGFIVDMGVHYIAGLRMLVGCEVVSVSAMTSHVDLTLPPPDNISSVFHLENGCSGVFVMVVSSRTPKTLWRVVGLNGTLQVERGFQGEHGYLVSLYGADGQNQSSFFPFGGVTEELKAFINDVSENTLKQKGSQFVPEPRLSFVEGARDVAVLEAMLESGSKQGELVQVKKLRLIGECGVSESKMHKPEGPPEFALKETSPNIGAGAVMRDKLSCTYDLVEQMQYLYVRVVKAKDLPGKDVTGGVDPYVEVKLGNYKGLTKHFEKKSNPQWNHVFAFSKESIQASVLEVVLKDKDVVVDEFVGRVMFDLNEIPKRVPPDSPLAPQWYRLEDRRGEKAKGELMLAVWMGTQADEAFPDAWHSDAATIGPEAVANIRSKVYLSPKLWYVRVNVIEAQDLIPSDKTRYPEVFVKANLGNQFLRTRASQSKTINPMWNEDLMFVAAEPFEEPLVLTAEDRVGPNKDEILGRCVLPLHNVQRRLDHKPVNTRWFNLEKHVVAEGEKKKEPKFSSRIHLRVCLEGGYHVLDESTHYSSDLRPTAKQLWKASIGVLEVGIISAQGLMPMKTRDGRGTTDAYCVAKYGQKWIRTRTIVDSLAPRWNEQYIWEVFDPCTVITVGVYDNGHLHGGEKSGGSKDSRIGKVRIRLSTLEADRVYTHSYPLLVLHNSGVKKMGEVQLAVKFTSLSLINMLSMYSQPLLPKMHYIHPLSVIQQDSLRHQAIQIVSMRLSRAEPPLRKEVVEYMLDVDSHMWSMRRSKANFFRITIVLGGLIAFGRWFDQICNWKNPLTSILIHILFIILVLYPELILPTTFLYLSLIGIWNFRWRPRHPPHMDTRLSHADAAHPDELDEEFDTFPTSRSSDMVRMRYDRLRSIAGKVQTVVGDLATQGERFHNLLSWRDTRATTLFVTFCFIAALVLYVTPFQVVFLLIGFYVLRHPRFRHKHPSAPFNYFKRLPARVDTIL